ncbi:MAG: Nif3-like dinuclear metal center hexameric protein, partial [Longimicrobiales bacterium]|nr:Nif3-like dinuclear metal center hexameric protein [Longimicrobiales bacterium]
ALDLELEGRLGAYEGHPIGWWGRLTEPASPASLESSVANAVGSSVRRLPGGPERIETVGVLTGGGGSFVAEAAELGLDAFVTGEGAHHNYFDATELGIHVIFAGHYATETFGVRALGQHLTDRFGIPNHFVHQPTGL